MILLCGIPSETPLALVTAELERLGTPYRLFNQRHFATIELSFEISGGQVTGWIRMQGDSFRLEEFQGVYTRLMDDQLLPELRDEAPRSAKRRYCRSLHETLTRWYEIAPCRVVNRTAPMGSNFSKPYQSQIIKKQGFAIPETLITNDPEAVYEFRKRYGRLIYKSTSGVRSIVQTLEDEDIDRLDHIRWCPVQFQQFIEGTNVRVHVVDMAVFATSVNSEATDYRYASQQIGSAAELTPIDLPDDIVEKCVKLAKALRLPFAGIDLKVTPDGQVFCFEVNPSPAFSYYEANTGQPIARALACYLSKTVA